jgi:hypothetical protein
LRAAKKSRMFSAALKYFMPVLEIYWSTGENILNYYWSILNNYGILKKSPLCFHPNRVEIGKDNSSSDDHFKNSKARRCSYLDV